MRLIAISDTHMMHDKIQIPEGDILVHCGDFTKRGSTGEVSIFLDWFEAQPHPNKIFISGNHDAFCQDYTDRLRKELKSVIYLQDEEVTVEGIRIYGSPWTPWFHDWAFNLRRGFPIRQKWELLPEGLDVLLTHGPPYGIMDMVDSPRSENRGHNVGCEELFARLVEMKKPPKVNVFGHIHEGYGIQTTYGIKFVNASICDVMYRPVNKPWVIEL